jgi:hypothetical protein
MHERRSAARVQRLMVHSGRAKDEKQSRCEPLRVISKALRHASPGACCAEETASSSALTQIKVIRRMARLNSYAAFELPCTIAASLASHANALSKRPPENNYATGCCTTDAGSRMPHPG